MPSVLNQVGATQQTMLRALLRSQDGLTVDALSSDAGITPTAVRQHLTTLMAQGFVQRGMSKPTGGRPGQVFTLTETGREVFPRRYAELAAKLIESIGSALGEEQLDSMMTRLGSSVGEDVLASLANTTGSERIEAIATVMSELGYDTDKPVKKGKQVPEIVAHNCVFHHLASRFPPVCSFDLAFLERSSGARVEHAECMVRGGNACRFRFHRS